MWKGRPRYTEGSTIMAAIVHFDELTTIVHEIDDVPEWSWEMSRDGATIRLSGTDSGAVCVAIERDVFDAETQTTRLSNAAFYLEGNQREAFARALTSAVGRS